MTHSVLLVAMPWNRADYPSIQVGLLKAHLTRHGIAASALYPYLELERRIGSDLYLRLADKLHPILGESLFAAMLTADPDLERLGDQFVLETEELDLEEICRVRSTLKGFIHDLLEADYWKGFELVGFTCSFNQIYASLLLANGLKQRYPRIRTVFGGSAMHGDAGRSYFSTYDFIDYLVMGPGEDALTRLATALPLGREVIEAPPSEPRGAPNFDEYFSSVASTTSRTAVLSASNGCTSGRCAFCAQNSQSGYRKGSRDQLLQDMSMVTRQYSADRVEFSDTCFPLEFFQGGWPAAIGALGVRCFAQVRTFGAFAQGAAMKVAGFDQVQVGIESFNERTLKRMAKPSSVLENIQCLRVAYSYSIDVGYNLILDFPGTSTDELEEMAALLPAIFHLQPPTALVPFALHQGSAVHSSPSRFGLTTVRPHRYYNSVSPAFAAKLLKPLFFDFDNLSPPEKGALERVNDACRSWVSAYDPGRPLLAWSREAKSTIVRDGRDPTNPTTYALPEAAAKVFELVQEPLLQRDLAASLDNGTLIHEGLAWLRLRRLIFEGGDQMVALPIEDGVRSLRPPDELDSYFAPNAPREPAC